MRRLVTVILVSLMPFAVNAVPIEQLDGNSLFDVRYRESRTHEDLVAAVSTMVNPLGRLGESSFPEIATLLDDGAYSEAITLAKSVIEELPSSSLAFELIGVAQFEQGDMDAAHDSFMAATSSDPEVSGPWTKLGIVQMIFGETESALVSLNRAVKIDPNDRIAHQRLGLIHDHLDNVPEAIDHYSRGLRGTSNDILGVALPLGRRLNSLNKYKETVALLAPRILPTSNDMDAQVILSTALLATGDINGANERFERIRITNPTATEPALGLAKIRRVQGDVEGAIQMLREVERAHPDVAAIQLDLGESLLAINHVDEAERAFFKYAELANEDTYPLKRMAQYRLDTGDRAQALELFLEVITMESADVDSFVRLAELQLSEDDVEAGVQTLKRGIEKFPESAYLRYRTGSYLASVRRYDVALTEFKKGSELEPTDLHILRATSLLQTRIGNHQAALDSARAVHEASPTRPDAAIFLATRLRRVGQFDEAETLYRRVLAADADNPVALNNLANLLLQQRKYEEAKELAQRAVTAFPNSGQLLDTLGWIAHEKGELQEAVNYLERAVEIEPSRPVIRFHLGNAYASVGDRDQANEQLSSAINSATEDDDWVAEARSRLESP